MNRNFITHFDLSEYCCLLDNEIRRFSREENPIEGLSFTSNRQRRKEGTIFASEFEGIEPTPPAQEEQDMPAFTN
jgi:hypothetical protein